MKIIRLLAILVYLFVTACSPLKQKAVPASSPAIGLPTQLPSPSPPPSATPWVPPLQTVTPAVAASLSVDEQIAQLLQAYQLALDQELATGDTVMVKNDDGTKQKMLEGKSKEDGCPVGGDYC
jgi:hypothetical protein